MNVHPTFHSARRLAWFLLPLVGLGCSSPSPGPDGFGGGVDCHACHGTEASPAPPRALNEDESTSALGVGAHQAHLSKSSQVWRPPGCAICHVVPEQVLDEGHVDPLPAEVRFGELAIMQDVEPRWDRDRATCSDVYCHGATLKGGEHRVPVWTQVDGRQATCASCHGFPPPAPHPESMRCSSCHPGTVDSENRIDLDGGRHLDGQLDVATDCGACHGSSDNPAPPADLQGRQDTTALGVGAHQVHVLGGQSRQPVGCEACHRVPATLRSEGHLDAAPADLTWSDLATGGGELAPAWDREAATCSQVYCHGATLSGGDHTQPVWIQVDGSQARCSSCHGAPPPEPHPQIETCGLCHPDTVDRETGTIDLAGGHHIDGVIDALGESCDDCHGSEVNPAPPRSLAGSEATTEIGVGAHQAHLVDGARRQALECTACHQVPEAIGDAGHLDDPLPAELSWGPLSVTAGSEPAWDRAQATCSGVYCHGATLAGGAHPSPVWTQVDGSQVGCDGCHGAPPPAPHPPAPSLELCGGCHPGTLLPGEAEIDVAGGQHIDGTLDVARACDACHGGEGNPAPPRALDGSEDTGALGVGAHRAHLGGPSGLRAPIACAACHRVPEAVTDEGHLDGAPADLTWGGLAAQGGAEPAWDRAQATCAGVYCHGATLSGGAHTSPVWTEVDGTQIGCDGCHGNPPPAPHPQRRECGTCHPGTLRPDGAVDLDTALHMNGTLDVAAACNACHGDADSPAPPRDLGGNVDPESIGVGAHRSHLRDTDIRQAVPCEACHMVPEAVGDEDHLDPAPADLVWGELATGAGRSQPTWDRESATCSDVYCHGATLEGGRVPAPVWTRVGERQGACGACHGVPPPAPHSQFGACARCHPGFDADGNLDVASGLHINGQVEALSACDACHGDAESPAPPFDLVGSDDTAEVGVGAHRTHVLGNELRGPIACRQCHVVPGAVGDPGHVDAAPAELVWGPLATGMGAVEPVWDRQSETCSEVYCHGATLEGGVNPQPQWTVVDGTEAACGSCHSLPPPAPHPAEPNCFVCHRSVVTRDLQIDVAAGHHINGRVDF